MVTLEKDICRGSILWRREKHQLSGGRGGGEDPKEDIKSRRMSVHPSYPSSILSHPFRAKPRHKDTLIQVKRKESKVKWNKQEIASLRNGMKWGRRGERDTTTTWTHHSWCLSGVCFVSCDWLSPQCWSEDTGWTQVRGTGGWFPSWRETPSGVVKVYYRLV